MGKLTVAAIVAVLAVIGADEPWQYVIGAAVVAAIVAWALRDLVAPVRLAVGPDGVDVVTGFGRRRRLGWPEIERVRVDVRRRSRMLEIDVGDHLYLFSRYDLDADLDRVADVVNEARADAR